MSFTNPECGLSIGLVYAVEMLLEGWGTHPLDTSLVGSVGEQVGEFTFAMVPGTI